MKPNLTGKEFEEIKKVLDSGYLTEGPKTKEFEEMVKKYLGVKHVIACSNCTVAMEMCLRAAGIGPGDEVIVPDYTYPATLQVVPMVGATPVLVDCDIKTRNIDYDEIEKAITDKTKAIIPVSQFGNPLDLDRLNEIAKKHNLIIIEDAACSLGAEYKGKKVGTGVHMATFSLHPRKFITTGEGGLITTDNDEWAKFIFSYKRFGMIYSEERSQIVFDKLGTNYKISDILSALGVSQMREIDERLAKRIEIAKEYDELLKGDEIFSLSKVDPESKHNYQSYTVFIEKDVDIIEVIKKMKELEVEVQVGTYCLHEEPAYENVKKIGNLENSSKLKKRILTLPLHHDLTLDDQKIVIEKLKKVLRDL
jgi:perosamine synthetase